MSDITDNDREEISARLRALQQAFNATDQDMALAAGVTRSAWTSYITENPKNWRMIPPKAKRGLKQQFGVTGDWIEMGDARLIDDDLRRKLNYALAHPRARKRGRPPNRA